MLPSRLLVVEDDDRIRMSLQMALEDEGYVVVTAATGEEGLLRQEQHAVDVVLLDLMLPGIDGFDFLRELRRSSDIPVVVISAREDTHDIVAALEAGADDYLVKPVAVKELSARLRALRRRANASGSEQTDLVVIGDLEVRPGAGEVRRGGKELGLTRTEFRLLCELVSSRGLVLSRAQLLQRVWEYDFGDERLVDVHIGRLRRKIEQDASDPQLLVTVRGLGYKVR